jgi:hypothetical protein
MMGMGTGRFGGVELRASQLRRELKSVRRELGRPRLGKGKADNLAPHPKGPDHFLPPELRRIGRGATQEEIGPKRFIPKPIISSEIPDQRLEDRLQLQHTDDRFRWDSVMAAESVLDRVEGMVQKAHELLDQAEREIIQAREPPRGRQYGRWW